MLRFVSGNANVALHYRLDPKESPMPIPALVGDDLPLGRWPATAAEVEGAFVAGKSDVRAAIWNEWNDLTAALREAVPIAAAWIGGSFLTSKAEPGDIDCVYVIDWLAAFGAKADARKAQLLEAVARSQVKKLFGLRVDSFVLEWWPTAGPGRPEIARRYLESRGYWDDLWSRRRSANEREDSIPRVGYLEVIIDGYI